MGDRLRTVRASFVLLSAGPFGLATLMAPEPFALLGHAAAAAAVTVATIGGIWFAIAYARYRWCRRRFRRVLLAENALRGGWLPARRRGRAAASTFGAMDGGPSAS